MSRDKQIEEMARIVDDNHGFIVSSVETAEALYAAGYRKSRDVAEEIFAAVDATIDLVCAMTGFDITIFGKYAELKKKYIGKDTNVTTNTEDGE